MRKKEGRKGAKEGHKGRKGDVGAAHLDPERASPLAVTQQKRKERGTGGKRGAVDAHRGWRGGREKK